MNALRHGLPTAALAVAIAALWLHLSTLLTGGTTPAAAGQPELYIVRPDWRAFGEPGQLQSRLRADRLEKWPSEREARLTEPRIEMIDSDRVHWQAQARRGRLDEDRRQLRLEQQVRLQRGARAGALVVTTETLQIGERGGLIETDRPVVLESGSWHFTATGLRAELGRQQLQLLENVRGIHD